MAGMKFSFERQYPGDGRGTERTGPFEKPSDRAAPQTPITDAGLRELASLKSMFHLNITGTKVTPEGVALRKALAELRHRGRSRHGRPSTACRRVGAVGRRRRDHHQGGRQATSESRASPTCRRRRSNSPAWICEAGPRVSDAGLAAFKDCKNLTLLDTSFSPVTDAGLVHFAGCKNLKTRNLFGLPVGNAGGALRRVQKT